jgi:ADP-heptose:LPS heptosyltransferase
MARVEAGGTVPPPRRVAILRALQLGDMLCAVPALRAFRRAWPRAEIVLVGLPWARAFASRFDDYVDEFRELPGYPGLVEQREAVDRIPRFVTAMQRERFDLAIQLHGCGTITNPLVMLFGARQAAGFYVPGEYCPSRARFAPWPQRGLEIDRLLSLATFLGLPTQGRGLEFPLDERDFAELDQLPEAQELVPGRYACLHPGASTPLRRWPAANFAAVADELAGLGLAVVITGIAAERELADEVVTSMKYPALNLAGRTSLGAAAALIGGSALLICNDTGVSHVAAALEVPSVVVSTGDNPARWAPINRRLHHVLCRPDGVRVEEVRRAAWVLLASHAAEIHSATSSNQKAALV